MNKVFKKREVEEDRSRNFLGNAEMASIVASYLHSRKTSFVIEEEDLAQLGG